MITVWLVSTLAALGGLAVFVGLWFEKKGDQGEYEHIEAFRIAKCQRKIGERLVRWGVFAEMLLGFVIATWDGWQELKSSPFNQPVSDIAATAVIEIKGSDIKEIDTQSQFFPTGSIHWKGMLSLRDSNTNSTGLLPGFLVCDEFNKMFAFSTERGNNTQYSLRFHLEDTGIIGSTKKASEISRVKFVFINAFFLPTNSVVTWGRVSLIVNSEIQSSFTVMPQNHPSVGFYGMPGIGIIATNSTPENVVHNMKN
jgi:hypothetical protein